MVRNKKIKTPFSSPPLFFHSFFSDSSKLLPLPSGTGGLGMWGWGQSMTVHLCRSLLLTPTPAWVLHGLRFLQDQPAPAWAVHGLQSLREISTCSGVGSSVGWSVEICSSVVCSPRSTSSPPPPLALLFVGLFLSHFLLTPHMPVEHFALSSIPFHSSTSSFADGLGCVPWWVHLGTGWSQPCRGAGQPPPPLREEAWAGTARPAGLSGEPRTERPSLFKKEGNKP